MNCAYCGIPLKPVDPKNCKPDQKSRDHVVPRHMIGEGGLPHKLNVLNIIDCCYGCNQDKGGLSRAEYRLVMAFRAGMHIEMPQLLFANETFEELCIENLLLEALS